MDIVSMGVVIMDMFPGESGVPIAQMPFWKSVPGGAPANVAAGAAKLGAKSAFIGKVGEDAFGHRLKDVLEACGVDMRGLRFDDQARTTLNFHAKPRPGEVEYLFYRNPGADTRLAPGELDDALFEGIRAYHYDSMNLTHEPMRSATLAAIQKTHAEGGAVSFDANYRPPVWENPAQATRVILEAVRSADIVKINEIERELLFPGCSNEETARRALALGPKLLLMTLGAEGVFFAAKSAARTMPARKIKAVDTIGCGDSFVSAFLTEFAALGKPVDQISPEEMGGIVAFSQAAAAVTAMREGVIPALPTRADVQDMLTEVEAL